MVFGNEHLGRAVAFLRDSQNLKQHELAARIGIKPGTLNQYESGRRGMTEDLLKKIARTLELDEIVIWDTAYKIVRYNYFRGRADAEGIPVEELIARIEVQPSIDQLMESYDAKTEQDRQYTELNYRFMESLGRRGPDGYGILKIAVQPREQKTPLKKAIRAGTEPGKTPAKSA
jgi:transcriptional regulator with XRE-family HTH domain